MRNLLSGIFRRKEEQPVDFSSVKTDMHSHLIPGIDDGAKTLEDSIMLIKEMVALGFTKLYTTPHIMSDYFRNTPEVINRGLETVRAEIAAQNIPVSLFAAAEYYIDDGFVEKLNKEKLLTIGDRYLLFEISYVNPPDNIMEIIFEIGTQGYKPILAHPERYPFMAGTYDMYKKMREYGVLLQINVNSLSGYYGIQAKRVAEKLIDDEMVDLIGADLHHSEHINALKKTCRMPYFKKVIQFNLLNKHL